jgi:hypothetical protein
MRANLHAPSRLINAIAVGLLVSSLSATAQEPGAKRQLPAPTDIDPQLTELLQRLERNLADAIVHKDAAGLERLVAPEYTLRVADIPEGSLPRAIWMDNSLTRLSVESVELEHCVARRLAANLAVVSLLYKQ